MTSNEMAGRTCLITGATNGIGKETAIELAKMGAFVVLVARDERKGRAAQSELKERSGADSDLLLADIDGIESEIQRLTNMMGEVSALTGAVQSERSKVMQLDGVVDVLSRLVWKLDTRGSTKFLDLIVDVSSERMEEARVALRDELCSRGYGGIYGGRPS